MRIRYEAETDQAYLYLKDISPGEAVIQVVCEDDDLLADIIIDLDAQGRVLGFEFPYDARSMVPEDLLR